MTHPFEQPPAADATMRDRRREPRYPANYAAWITRSHHEPVLGRTLNVSAGGAALILPRRQAPQVGEVIWLAPFDPESAAQLSTPPLESPGHVLRIEPAGGDTLRIAVRFKHGREALQNAPGPDTIVTSRTVPTTLLGISEQSAAQRAGTTLRA